VLVTAASVQDRDAGRLLLAALRTCFPRIGLVWVDAGYAGALVDWAATTLRLTVTVVRKLAGHVGFHVLPRRWVVERTLAWITR
jgi:transposase